MLFLGTLPNVRALLYKNTTGADVTVNLVSFVNDDLNLTAYINLYVSADDGGTLIPICKVNSPVVFAAPFINSGEFTLADGESIYGVSSIVNSVKGFISNKIVSSGGSSITNKHGAGSPIGVVTPDAIDQFYRRTDDPVGLYQATGLTNNDWIQWN